MTALITMRTFGKLGRAGNQILQYAFLRTHAREHGLRILLRRWDGNALFGTTEEPPPVGLRAERAYEARDERDPYHALPPTRPLRNTDVAGWCQLHTSYYRREREFVRSLFEPLPALKRDLDAALAERFAGAQVRVGVHIRRGDYGFGCFYKTPIAWYRAFLREHLPTLPAPALYVASDDPQARDELAEFHPVPPLPTTGSAPWYPDFYALSTCDVLLIPNSSFSFAAALLGPSGARVFRSNPLLSGFEPIYVWDDWPLVGEHSYPALSHLTELWTPDAAERTSKMNAILSEYASRAQQWPW